MVSRTEVQALHEIPVSSVISFLSDPYKMDRCSVINWSVWASSFEYD